jgi:protein phosphatase
MSDDSLAETVDDVPKLAVGAGPAAGPLDVDLAGKTDPGKVRLLNEDHFHIVQFGRYLRTLMSSLPAGDAQEEVDRLGHGFIVADGIGGRSGGELASRLAIGLLIEFARQTPDWILGHEDRHLATVMDRFAERYRAVNQAVIAHAQSRPGLEGMGTTLSVAVSLGDDLLVTHIGDSRVYLHREGRLYRLTRDHTVTQAVPHPNRADAVRFRRVLTHAIGHAETGGEPDLYHYKLTDGDRLLLCTDGLTDMVDDDVIARELGRVPAAADACRTLVELALDRGGRDNVTVVVATYRFRPPAGATPPA